MAEIDATAPAVRRSHRGRWIVGAVVVVLVLVAVTVLLILRHEDGKYGPVGAGDFGGLAGARHIVSVDDDGFGQYRLATSGGQTTYVYSSLANDGEHAITLTGVDTDDITVRAQWAPLPMSDDVALPQVNARWRDFPAEVDGVIQMRYEIRRPPHCQDKPMNPEMGEFYTDSHTVHWESLLGDHTTRVSGLDDNRAIQVC